MSIKGKNNNNNLPDEFTTNETKQVSFNDLEFEGEVLSDEEIEELENPTRYYTISGKESEYNPNWEKYGMQDFDIGDTVEGKPEINIFENKDKKYNALRLRLIDEDEVADFYVNFPKQDYPHVKNINKYFDFYRTCFDFIYSILRHRGDEYVVDEHGDEINKFSKVNLEAFAKYVDQMSRVGIKIIKGNAKSEYNSWIIYKME